jgi:tetratricopeptide (TPR) repeat protein
LIIHPERKEAYTNLSALLCERKKFETAHYIISQGILHCGGDADLYFNLGNILKTQSDYKEALEAYRTAIQLRPHMARAHWNKALTHLALGQYRNGWREYEWRLHKKDWPDYYPYHHDTPLWRGEDISDQTLLVHDEQGYGDTIQFFRYLKSVKCRCKSLVFETRKPLMALFADSPHIDHLVERPASVHGKVRWDCHVPLLSIPYLFKTELSTIPRSIPYLTAEPDRIRRFRGAMAENKTNVGLVWAGNPKHHNDGNRSKHLNDLRHMFDDAGIAWHSLQKGPAAKQVLEYPYSALLRSYEEELCSFADTAALIWVLDYVISVDTAAAHLAGALGKPFKLILPDEGKDWRWDHLAARRLWYPSLMETISSHA